MSPAELAALRRLVDILEGPRAELVPAEALHAVNLIPTWKVEKGLRDLWHLEGNGFVVTCLDVSAVRRPQLVDVLRREWVPLARAAFNSPG